MTRHALLLPCLLLMAGAAPPPRLRDVPRAEERGTYLGALFSPADRRDYGPRGVVITHVLPSSPASRAGLRRDDVVLRYDGARVRDCEHLARLIRDDKPERTVKLQVQRGKRELTVEPKLTLGLPLKLAAAKDTPPGSAGASGTAKPPGRPSVSVWAAPLESGRMKVTVEYTADGGGRKSITCEGTAAEIAKTVDGLPEREKNLVRVAFDRLRSLNSDKAPAAKPAPPRAGER